ncbi:type I-U CRISPR-associated protein Csb2 [uncultured Thiodictyon sp.]|uniref:type I-G CRISPR-associated protein Csb2 n=1 Tax=uncultured Thiodictyon sp. TaxID=1846217 RepID=UPI0025DFA9C3|nr:type I-U CRISPR-associated protein Csb2 [uncultured Thiodictyon sp.]
MLTLALTFPAGRYHGTPWGRHVNEADVGWPPDAWRLTRALIATWHRKLNPEQFPVERLTDLLATLATEPPNYALPETVHFHTRHYMPVRDKQSLIFDAFAQVGREAQLIIQWPSADLTPPQAQLLDALLMAIGYLGRAESWVSASRITDWSGTCDCYPSEEAIDTKTGEVRGDLIPLWLPHPPERYAAIRASQLDAALARAKADVHVKRAQAIAEGKKKPPDPEKTKVPTEILATLPESWLDAISLDTGDLQSAGWSSPPAAHQVYYLRPKDALRFMAARPAPTRRNRPTHPVTTARFALYGKPLPRMTDAVRVGELLRFALMSRARHLPGEVIPASLSGHGLPSGNRHGHAFFLPEANLHGRIDHLVVHAPDGLDAQAQAAIGELAAIYTHEGAEWRVLLEGLGEPVDFAPHSPLLRTSACWESVTPYLHPWHRKRGFEVPEQIARECRARGLPEPSLVEPRPDAKPRALDFHRFRGKRGLEQPDRHGSMIRLEFSEPITGPLALGFGCHFGLGLFKAVGARGADR